MVFLFSLITAAFVVCGQALWKLAVTKAGETDHSFASVDSTIRILISWPLLAGIVVYGFATVAYIFLLSRYNYYQVQAVVVGGSLIFTAIVAKAFFGETISLVGYIGITFILVGALLVTK